MSGFWTVAWTLTGIAILSCVAPLLWRSRRGLDRGDSAMRVFKDQLGEIERDIARGVLNESEAQSATTEIKRRMLALARNTNANDKIMTSTTENDLARSIPVSLRVGILVLAVFGPAIGLFGYSWLGSPDLPAQPLAQRKSEISAQAELLQTAAQLQARLDVEGGNVDDWVLLGQTYMELQRPDEAIDAYRQAVAQPDADTVANSRLAEAILFSAGVITPEASAALDRALELQPSNVAAIFYKSVEIEQAGWLREALEMVQPVLATAPPDAPWRPNMQRRVDELAARVRDEGDQVARPPFLASTQEQPSASGPSAADIEAAGDMSVDDRNAMIRSMVERLAGRMEENPDNADGWLQLIQSYIVLGDNSAASAALEKASKAIESLAASDPRRQRLQELTNQLGS